MTRKVLFDQGVPVPLRRYLTNCSVDTAFELGWSTLENGALIEKAESESYEVFVTTDKNLKYQQNMSDRSIAIVVLPTPSWLVIQKNTDAIVEKIESSTSNSYIEIAF